MPSATEHLWGIILAGGEGRRLQSFIRLHWGSDRPKQYCALVGTRSMLRHTLARAEQLIARDRLLTVVTRSHLAYARQELHDRPPSTVIVQPRNRETGPGILLPLLHVARRDPEATVAFFPADHFIIEEKQFMASVASAAAFVSADPNRLVLLGVQPDRPEPEYGWIEAREAVGECRGEVLYVVKRFWEKPDLGTAQSLYLNGCLWNTLVLVGKASTLLQLFETLTPELYSPFERLHPVLGSPHEDEALEALYARLSPVNFSRAILARSPSCLGVLQAKGIYWSDWGNPRQIKRDLARFGARQPAPRVVGGWALTPQGAEGHLASMAPTL